MPDETAFHQDIDEQRRLRSLAGAPRTFGSTDHRIAELAAAQHGVVSRRQLIAAGLDRVVIDHRLECGRLQVVHRGVYSVGHPALTRKGKWMAAVLAGGTTARLSHRSAAELWQLVTPRDHRPDVTVGRSRRRHSGIRWHSTALGEDEVTVVRGIPVTTVPRTLLDLAVVLDRRGIERAIDQAEVRRYAGSLSLPALLARYPRRRGTATIRDTLAAGGTGTTVTRSELEERFLRFVDRRGLPRPELNVPIAVRGGFVEADCLWRGAGVIAELDGRAVHGTAGAFERDRARDRALIAAGWRVVRITWRQLSREPDRLAEDLAAILASNRPRAANLPLTRT